MNWQTAVFFAYGHERKLWEWHKNYINVLLHAGFTLINVFVFFSVLQHFDTQRTCSAEANICARKCEC